jgi:hypothetical protein
MPNGSSQRSAGMIQLKEKIKESQSAKDRSRFFVKPALLRLVLGHANRLPEPARARLGRAFSLVAHPGHLGCWLGARWRCHRVSLSACVLGELLLQHAVFGRAW